MLDQQALGDLEIQSARHSEGHHDRGKHIAVVEPWYGRRTYQDHARERVLRGAAQKHCEARKLLQSVSRQRCIHVARLGSDELIRYVEALE